MRSVFQSPRLAEMVPFGLLDVPCQTSHIADHDPLSPNHQYYRGPGDLGFFERVFTASQTVEHGPLSSAATAGLNRAHYRADMPDRKGICVTLQMGEFGDG
ncbi:hypothetical protein [Acidithiobacillus sulfurivorans]|uniref:Uncharacterized protein n=1 Tax=Acidithiobacillus sulfurivorans TaxID=1958756 RepID=A0ABS5ZVF8_9PROT|nr:hypothetical protein [Acidithiobacillus sulfurivorans]MBU2759050.1 hypothetical protein [Acidithiobacillus sulfurivorans]